MSWVRAPRWEFFLIFWATHYSMHGFRTSLFYVVSCTMSWFYAYTTSRECLNPTLNPFCTLLWRLVS